jgi:hypothetical protein
MNTQKLAEAGEFIRRNQGGARLAGVTALVLAMSVWTSCSARSVTSEARAAMVETAAVRATATRIAQQFTPATTAETDEWSRTTEEAAEFATSEALKVSIAQSVSRIAEVAGMSSVRASFIPAESVGHAAVRTMGDLTFQPGAFGLKLEANGTVSQVARVILRLPPATELSTLSLSGGANELKATFQLTVYQSGGGPQN